MVDRLNSQNLSIPKIVAIILNTNRKMDTLACIQSIEENQYPNIQIVVLDNASTDGSADAIKTLYPHVNILVLNENKGYAGNNNVGLEFAIKLNPDWIFVLNEDIILDKNALDEMMCEAKENPKAGIIGPLVFHFDEPEIIQSAGGSFTKNGDSIHISQNEKDSGQYEKPFEVSWISGCAIGVRLEAIQQAGLIDERFFYYWEETDWCFRIKEKGWKAIIVPKAKIWHKGVQRNYLPSPNVTYYATRNRLLFNKKHKVSLLIWMKTVIELLRITLSWSLRPKWKHLHANRDALVQGFMDFLKQRWGQRQMNTTKPY
jgi:GT2 family glycosyltransferase